MKKFSLSLIVALLSAWMLLGTDTVPVFGQDGDAPAASAKKTVKKKTSKKKKSTKKKAKAAEKDRAEEEPVAEKPKVKPTEEVKEEPVATEEQGEELVKEAEKEVEEGPSDEEKKEAEEVLSDDKDNEEPEPAAEEESAAPTKRVRKSKLNDPGSEAGEQQTVTVNRMKYTFRWCPAGTFQMGSPETEPGHVAAEKQHEVKLTKGFWMLETEVTQEMYESVMEKNPSYFARGGFGEKYIKVDGKPMDTKKFPVDRVKFSEAEAFCDTFSDLAGGKFTLPTEAQWEYACRAGTTTAYYTGENVGRKEANYNLPGKEGNLDRTELVGEHGENAWGLCDMMGNVSEWCSDWFDETYYDNVPATDPTGPETGSSHVIRGGNWNSVPYYCRSATRNYQTKTYTFGHNFDGFRIVIVPESDEVPEEVAEMEKE